jgi:hypothetical protein
MALLLAIGIGCSTAEPKDDSARKSGAAANGGASSGGAGGASSANGQAGHAAAAGSGGTSSSSTSGSGGQTATATAGHGGASTDAGTSSDCFNAGKRVAEGATVLSSDGCNDCTCSGGELLCTMVECQDSCLVARHLDTCCGTFEAVRRSALIMDECLVPYPGTGLDETLTQRCLAKSPTDCTLVDCAAQPAPSRIARSNGMGGCTYGDECQNDEGCVVVSDVSACCACPESWPMSLVDENPCLRVGGKPSASCPSCTAPVQCGMCPAPIETATCLIRDSFSVCQ